MTIIIRLPYSVRSMIYHSGLFIDVSISASTCVSCETFRCARRRSYMRYIGVHMVERRDFCNFFVRAFGTNTIFFAL